MKLKIKPCSIVERDHKKSLRSYAHYGHRPNIICISKAIYGLPLNHSIALLLHEMGHALLNGGSEEEANEEAHRLSGISIRYLPSTPWGNRLQYIQSSDLKKVYSRLMIYVELSSLKSFQLLP